MDRSFLSDARLIEASRNFVCIRLATYEEESEAAFLKTVFLPQSGLLENTTFGLLSPDGKRRLSRAGRSPQFAFRSAREMASAMDSIAEQYPGSDDALWKDRNLPVMEDVRMALNVAACDRLPVMITIGGDSKVAARLHDLVKPLAWSSEFAGRFIYATASKQDDLQKISGRKLSEGILIVRPDTFGTVGDVLAEFPQDIDRADLKTQLKDVITTYESQSLEYDTHMQLGNVLKVDWKSELPVTDRQSNLARERALNGGSSRGRPPGGRPPGRRPRGR